MYSEIKSFTELPPSAQLGNPNDKFLVVYDDSGALLQVYSQEELVNTPEQALNILKFAVDNAFALANKTVVIPSPKLCAWLAHKEADKYSDVSQGLSPLEQKEYLTLMHQFNEISDRFAKEQMPHPVYNPNNRVVAFKVKGDHGHTYSVDAGATHCTCAAGMKNQECWHVRMVDVYLMGIQYERSN